MLAACSAVSMPSATVVMSSDRLRATMAPARAADGVGVRAWTNSLAILSASTGNWRRWLSEK